MLSRSINVFSVTLTLMMMAATMLPYSTYAYSITWQESIHPAYFDKYFHRIPNDGRVFSEGYAGVGSSLFTFMVTPDAGEASTVSTILELNTLINSYQNIPGQTINNISGYFALIGPGGISKSLDYGLTTDHSLNVTRQEKFVVLLQAETEYLAYMDLSIDSYESASFLNNVTYDWDYHFVKAEGHLRIAGIGEESEAYPPVPEPATFVLLLSGIAAALFRRVLV